MSLLLRCASLLFVGSCLLLQAAPSRAQAPAPNAPDHLVLRFDPSAANLNHAAIYAAVAQEVQVIVADEGSEQAATLTVSVTSGGDIRLSYRPARETVERSIPVTNTSNVPRLIGHLAGNMVRDEASSLLANMGPNASTPTSASAQPSPPPSEQPATISIRPHTLDPWRNEPDDANDTDDGPYLRDKWITSALVGGAVHSLPQGRVALHQTKRFDRLEVGVGFQFGVGLTRVRQHGYFGSCCDERERTVYDITLPLSAEYRVLGNNESYLQIGSSFGLRISTLQNQETPAFSNAAALLAIELHATAGFRVSGDHGVIVRATLGVLPRRYDVHEDYKREIDPMQPTLQLGYQAGW